MMSYIILLAGSLNGGCDRLENCAKGLMADLFGAGINGWWHPRGVEGIETRRKHAAAHRSWFCNPVGREKRAGWRMNGANAKSSYSSGGVRNHEIKEMPLPAATRPQETRKRMDVGTRGKAGWSTWGLQEAVNQSHPACDSRQSGPMKVSTCLLVNAEIASPAAQAPWTRHGELDGEPFTTKYSLLT